MHPISHPLPTLAVVMPVLNEAAVLPALFQSLHSQTQPADRVIVVDGGSRDGSPEIAGKLGAQVLAADSPGRGNQIALGVERASEDIVAIAHADMVLDSRSFETIRRFLRDRPACPGGALGHRFDSRSVAYRIVEWFDRRRAKRGHSYGDQVQFFRREVLESAGGFPAQPIMEDIELANRLRSIGSPVYLDCPATVSTRRFEKLGLIRTLWQNRQFRRAYLRGGPTATRAIFDQYYRRREDLPGRRSE